MIFRTRAAEAAIWRRFRSGTDRFLFTHLPDGVYRARVIANAEQAVDLFYTLSEHLPPAVDFVLEDRRAGHAWRGDDVALPDVRDTIARLKVPLATYGGVDMSVYTSDDQLTLTASLGLYVFARSDRWLYLLQGTGLEVATETEYAQTDQPWSRAAVPSLRSALEAAAQRLSLEAV